MNPNFFKKAFSDIKKQAKAEVKSIQSAQRARFSLKSNLVGEQNRENSSSSSSSSLSEKKRQTQTFVKRIAKTHRTEGSKRWKHDRFEKRQIYSNMKSERNRRTILIEEESQLQGASKLIKILKNWKIQIQQIKEYKIVFSNQKVLVECMNALREEKVKFRRASQAEKQEVASKKQVNNIFKRISKS